MVCIYDADIDGDMNSLVFGSGFSYTGNQTEMLSALPVRLQRPRGIL